MEKIDATSLTELNGHPIELGVTKIRQNTFPPGIYLVPLFIYRDTSLATNPEDDSVGAINTDADWMIYDESLHSVENFKHISVEEFFQGIKDAQDKEAKGRDVSGYIMKELDILLRNKAYDRVAEILNQTNLDGFVYEGAGVSMMVASNPISPLTRPIPQEDNVVVLNEARNRFYDKCEEFYNRIKPESEAEALLRNLKPKNYSDEVEGYDRIYGGLGAPKE